jgi:hypothetical protein
MPMADGPRSAALWIHKYPRVQALLQQEDDELCYEARDQAGRAEEPASTPAEPVWAGCGGANPHNLDLGDVA